ncbi:MAG: radical SAM family heme chaperone HemW, partial [Thermodesulfovibrionales bacterium]|nr:radical SAM family heme chaperone HemW [Thermodesulfovibrionales bacterium]
MPEFLYIHIPFCIKKCIYCDFLSVTYDESYAKEYVDALCKELVLKKDSARALKTIYIGGGTPTVLPSESIEKLFKCLKDNFHFSPSIEITVEANPGTLNESKIGALLSPGVNRISIGVQSFNNNELKTLGRIHSSNDAVKAIEMIKKAGINNFSIDLMYGIPGQTMDSWRNTLSMAVNLSPTHISSYELTPEKETPLYEMIKSEETNPLSPPFTKGGMGGLLNKIKMPDEELVLDMYNFAIDYLASKGCEHYEISNFALRGFRCIHNMNYWNRGEYIGAGAGAHSFINGVRSKNTGDVKKYIETVNSGTIPEIESMRLTRTDDIKEFIFLGLRKTEGISILKAKELGMNIPASCKELIDEGYLEISGDYLRLTRKGIAISNTVIVRIF